MDVRDVGLSQCSGCGTCVDVCPEDVFRMDKQREQPFQVSQRLPVLLDVRQEVSRERRLCLAGT